jgi:SpoVK/Ycf46/Vps4 family AAA+-type ATPase
MADAPTLGTDQKDLVGSTCPLCQQGTIQQESKVFHVANDLLFCTNCSTEFLPAGENYILRNIPPYYKRWVGLEGQIVSVDEMQRIQEGRLSASEIVAAKAQSKKEGTPEYYAARMKEIFGLSADEDNERSLTFMVSSKAEIDQHLAHVKQVQNELELLKKEINQKIKQQKLQVDAAAPYESVNRLIEGNITELERAKLALENHQLTTNGSQFAIKDEPAKSLEDCLKELDRLIGLESVKKEVRQLVDFLTVQGLRKSRGLAVTQVSLHQVYSGNPGTGKTSVARLMAEILKSLNLLKSGHLVETDRAGLVAGYVGQTAIKVTDVVNKALGGVLFIDEAYSLSSQESARSDFGLEAIETLLKLMEDHRDNLVIIAAGYTDKMRIFLGSNPGLKSRFNHYLHFEDYSPGQLTEIFEGFARSSKLIVPQRTSDKILNVFRTMSQSRDETFGNGRLARNMFESAINNQASRIVSIKDISNEILSTLEPDDILDGTPATSDGCA